mgnify:CR=1 FL=1
MHVLVTTSHSLLLVDTATGDSAVVHRGQGVYYGLAVTPDAVYVAARNNADPDTVDARGSHVDQAAERGSVLEFDKNLRFVRERSAPFPLRDMHGILYSDGQLFITCTYDNMVAVLDLHNATWRRWYPAPDPDQRDTDVHHFNTLVEHGDHFYLLAHNFGPSRTLVFSKASWDLVAVHTLGNHGHDLWFENNALHTCNSFFGAVENEHGLAVRTNGLPRGTAATDNVRVVGVSELASRSERSRQTGTLKVYDRQWRLSHNLSLHDEGMVLALALPPAETPRINAFSGKPGPVERIERADLDWAYELDQHRTEALLGPLQWHEGEPFRWSAALDASVDIVVNPDDRAVWLEVYSGYPGRFYVGILANDVECGKIEMSQPGNAEFRVSLPEDCWGWTRITLRVPHLWQPTEDPRRLGLAVRRIGLST